MHHPPDKWICSPTLRIPKLRYSGAFMEVSLCRYNWLKPWLMVMKLPSPSLGLEESRSWRFWPSDHIVGFSGDQPPSWNYFSSPFTWMTYYVSHCIGVSHFLETARCLEYCCWFFHIICLRVLLICFLWSIISLHSGAPGLSQACVFSLEQES